MITFIQSVTAESGGSTSLASGSFSPTQGNCLIVVTGSDNGAETFGVSDNHGNIWTQAFSNQTGTATSHALFYAFNIKGGPSNIVTCTWANGGSVAFVIQEFSGILGQKALDVTIATANGLSTSAASGTSTTTRDYYELVVGTASNASALTFTVGSGYSNLAQTGDGANIQIGMQSKIVTATGTQSSSMAMASANWTAGIASFIGTTNKISPARLRPHPFSPGLAR